MPVLDVDFYAEDLGDALCLQHCGGRAQRDDFGP